MITKTPITKHYNDVAKCWHDTLCMIQTNDPIRPRMIDALDKLKRSIREANKNEAQRTAMAKALQPFANIDNEYLEQRYLDKNDPVGTFNFGARPTLNLVWQQILQPMKKALKPLLAA